MDLKSLVGSVTIATLGLTSCNNNGAVDPAPQPLQCSTVGGSSLQASGIVTGMVLHVEVVAKNVQDGGFWKSAPAVTNVTGGTSSLATLSAQNASMANITIQLSSLPATGSFTVSGTITDSLTDCPVTRVFTFTVGDAGTVMLAEADDVLPLRSLEPASIVVVKREGAELDLTPAGVSVGSRVTWTATAGGVTVRHDGGATWSVPGQPGLYQIELLVERSEAEGVALDTLVLEVT